MLPRSLLIGSCFVSFLFFVAGSWVDARAADVRATPYRPTVSNPADLPVPGYLEIEAGGQALKAKSDDTRRRSVPYRFKLAFNDRVGLLLDGQGVISVDVPGSPTQSGFGDVTGVLKLRQPLMTETPSALGMELGVKLPTAPTTVGSGHTDFLAIAIYSGLVGPFVVDLNLRYTRLGGAPGNEEKDQLGWVTTLSYGLTDRWGVAGEFFGFHREGVRPFLQYLTATNYFLTPRIVVDAGVAFGLTGASQEWTAFAGVTVLTWNVF